MTTVVSPVAGRVTALAEVPDAVFAGQLVGAGVAVEPSAPPAGDGADARVSVVSPIAGEIVKLHPHAFVVVAGSGTGVLVHVGIDTVKLGGSGFELAVAEGATVAAGDLVVRFDPAVVAEAGYSAVVPVVVLDSAPDSVSQQAVGTTVASGAPLFDL
ncbi:PTS glucose transporter subunit IIA [Frigoribacterium sp. PhB24]|uniref:PTS sugar transporter subunit IIA n=1 Tax=Frigoribacterium sp. PhB24 TaxID=2485204 RepID=UPI000F497A59|nr:PTS glucose transporter subunit IIA [Frigoribacterium sp. PhB24]ROS48033.1 PTS system N-acetylglucosamine-specific IIA component (Glc family) [Frigoribacterium sp. PhB24]